MHCSSLEQAEVVLAAIASFEEGSPATFLLAAIPVGVMALLGFSLLVIPIGHSPTEPERRAQCAGTPAA